jgi:hypothetical protein
LARVRSAAQDSVDAKSGITKKPSR